MSLNLQSLPAKYNDFSELNNSFNVNHCSPDIFCLQETWKCALGKVTQYICEKFNKLGKLFM
jgi:hypothetical protein